MSKHTAGPWTVIKGRHFYEDAFGIEGGENGFLIAPQTAMTEANARLIAAAPDLLEACEIFAEWLRREDAGFDHKTHDRNTPEGESVWREWFYGNLEICGKAQDKAKAAIAKARGEG